MSSSKTVPRPIDEKEAKQPAIVKVLKDVKWKLQPEAYNVRKNLMKALEQAVDASESLSCMCLTTASLGTHSCGTIQPTSMTNRRQKAG